MYRDPRLAAETQIEVLRAQNRLLTERLSDTEKARHRAETELDRVREGVLDDPGLDHDPGYRVTQTALRALAVICALAAIVGVGIVLRYTFAEPFFSLQGVLNLAWHVRHGEGAMGLAASSAAIVLLSPWLALPWVAAIGLRKHRRWGWFVAVVSAVLYMPTPLVIVAVPALTVLFSGRVRRVYFPR